MTFILNTLLPTIPGLLCDRQIALYCAGGVPNDMEAAWAHLTGLSEELSADDLTSHRRHDLRWHVEEIAALKQMPPMIAPFFPQQVREVYSVTGDPRLNHAGFRRIISKGLSSVGYDITLSDKSVKIFSNINGGEIDAKNFDENCLVTMDWEDFREADDGSRYVMVPPHSYMLGNSVEYFQMPNNVGATCIGKSTYARTCLFVNTTPLEPGWEGNLVIEMYNATSLPQRVYLDEGIAQLMFLQTSEPCQVSYKDRKGKYQGQTGVQLAKV